MRNQLGIELPETVGAYQVRPYMGLDQDQPYCGCIVSQRKAGHTKAGDTKLLPSIEDAILASGLKDGMTIYCHHRFR